MTFGLTQLAGTLPFVTNWTGASTVEANGPDSVPGASRYSTPDASDKARPMSSNPSRKAPPPSTPA
jgi:hypothetical protein